MSKNRNITKKSAPLIPPPASELKKVRISAGMLPVVKDAVQRFNVARLEAEEAKKRAQESFAKLTEISAMHDAVFTGVIVDGGATVQDYEHGFDIKADETGAFCLFARRPPEPMQQ